ncbi:TPA: transketolase [Patescibacteria group bacterium]|nr:transketolase [Patescibacteria group bacterium]
MLNHKLYLNKEIFSDKVEKKTTRAGFGSGLAKAGDPSADGNKNVVALTADLRDSVNSTEFAKKFPERFFECGVAEQNMITVASGLAISGKIPFTTSYAVFSPGRNWEQIRTTIAYNNVPVKIVGGHTGLLTSFDGATHQALEDIALMRVMPNIKVIVPCDFFEAEKATLAMAKDKQPNYLRLNRPELPVLTTGKTPFAIGKAQVFWTSSKPQVTIIACGEEVYYSLLAAKTLEEKNIEVEVINLSTVKPLDSRTILESVKKSGKVITVEDHQVAGGMGSAVAEFLAENYPVKIKFLGVHDAFGESGKPEELLAKHGLLAQDIVNAVKSL